MVQRFGNAAVSRTAQRSKPQDILGQVQRRDQEGLSGLLGRQGSAAVPALVHGCGAVKRAAMAKWLPIVKTDDVKLY